MPIFEFRCPSCGHQFEELILGSSESVGVHCPKCQREGVEKMLSVFSSGKNTSDLSSHAGAGCGSPSSSFS
jgi:putative FmdB family regulatory protein